LAASTSGFSIVPECGFNATPLKPHSGTMEKPDVLAANAEKLRTALASESPH